MPESVARHRETASAKNSNSGDLRNSSGNLTYTTSTSGTTRIKSIYDGTSSDAQFHTSMPSKYWTQITAQLQGVMTSSGHISREDLSAIGATTFSISGNEVTSTQDFFGTSTTRQPNTYDNLGGDAYFSFTGSANLDVTMTLSGTYVTSASVSTSLS